MSLLGRSVASIHFSNMMKTLLKEALAEGRSDDCKDLSKSLNIMATEKQKAEKAKEGGKKKKAPAKKQLARDRDDYEDIGLVSQGGGDHAGFDDGDFM